MKRVLWRLVSPRTLSWNCSLVLMHKTGADASVRDRMTLPHPQLRLNFFRPEISLTMDMKNFIVQFYRGKPFQEHFSDPYIGSQTKNWPKALLILPIISALTSTKLKVLGHNEVNGVLVGICQALFPPYQCDSKVLKRCTKAMQDNRGLIELPHWYHSTTKEVKDSITTSLLLLSLWIDH